MPTLELYRGFVLDQMGGCRTGLVDIDPDLADREAARSLISGALFDTEKLSNAYEGHYLWIPRYSDSRRVQSRGYRIRYVTVFVPPADGTYRIQVYGFGETSEIPAEATAAQVEDRIHEINEELLDVPVVQASDGVSMEIHLPNRIGVGSTAGSLRSKGGMGILLANYDFSQPLKSGTRWYSSSMIPFETEDELRSIHSCINEALADYKIEDMYPIAATEPVSTRDRVFSPWGLTPWLEHDMVLGYYAPTEWESRTTFKPPASGIYQVSLATNLTYGPAVTPLAHSATGAELEMALRSITGMPPTASSAAISVSPQGGASVYTITWSTQYHDARIVPTAGTILDVQQMMLREPYPLSIVPFYQPNYEAPLLSEPGFPEGSSWFLKLLRPGNTRICPQSYPRSASGVLDMGQPPILGTQWVESATGLVNDLDQAVPPVDKVWPVALRYILDSIGQAAPRGEKAEWEQAGMKQAGIAASKLIYGRQRSRNGNQSYWPQVGPQAKGREFWLPD